MPRSLLREGWRQSQSQAAANAVAVWARVSVSNEDVQAAVPTQTAGADPTSGLDRGQILPAAYSTTCGDGIADPRSWYSPLLRTDASCDLRMAFAITL
jgi:hypothetical protein